MKNEMAPAGMLSRVARAYTSKRGPQTVELLGTDFRYVQEAFGLVAKGVPSRDSCLTKSGCLQTEGTLSGTHRLGNKISKASGGSQSLCDRVWLLMAQTRLVSQSYTCETFVEFARLRRLTSLTVP